MPRLKPDTQRQRREHILDAAERCFSRSGFHATTMQDICKEAVVSPGALYVYFTSKEELIAGICERDRAEFLARFEMLTASADFLSALRQVADVYFLEEPSHKRLMCIETGLESTRNQAVGEMFHAVDKFVQKSFHDLFQRMLDQGRIAPSLDIATLASAFMIIGDGLFWRRAIDPKFNPEAMIPAMIELVRLLLNPVSVEAVRHTVEAAE